MELDGSDGPHQGRSQACLSAFPQPPPFCLGDGAGRAQTSLGRLGFAKNIFFRPDSLRFQQSSLCFLTNCRCHCDAGNQVAQSVRAQQASTGDDEAMHANAAGLQGQLAAAISVLDLASGGGHRDATGELVITAELCR